MCGGVALGPLGRACLIPCCCFFGGGEGVKGWLGEGYSLLTGEVKVVRRKRGMVSRDVFSWGIHLTPWDWGSRKSCVVCMGDERSGIYNGRRELYVYI